MCHVKERFETDVLFICLEVWLVIWLLTLISEIIKEAVFKDLVCYLLQQRYRNYINVNSICG